jgi:hypothetical protein
MQRKTEATELALAEIVLPPCDTFVTLSSLISRTAMTPERYVLLGPTLP